MVFKHNLDLKPETLIHKEWLMENNLRCIFRDFLRVFFVFFGNIKDHLKDKSKEVKFTENFTFFIESIFMMENKLVYDVKSMFN